MSDPQIQEQSVQGHRRAVLRVSYDVDAGGRIIGEPRLEPARPVQDDAPLSVREALVLAWRHARRCHPWIIGDDAIAAQQRAEQLRAAAIGRVGNLLVALRNLVSLVNNAEDLVRGRKGLGLGAETWWAGYLAALEHLRGTETVEVLYRALQESQRVMKDLRGGGRSS